MVKYANPLSNEYFSSEFDERKWESWESKTLSVSLVITFEEYFWCFILSYPWRLSECIISSSPTWKSKFEYFQFYYFPMRELMRSYNVVGAPPLLMKDL
jgi:hypothetical protein